MNSIILRNAAKFLLPLMLVFSLFILLRGHNEPGGGFIGGLIASSAFALYLMAYGPAATRRLLRVDLRFLIAAGLSCALISGLLSVISKQPFLTGQWLSLTLENKTLLLGTPMLFDVGVYLVVIGAILMIILALEEK